MKVFNLHGDQWEKSRDREGWRVTEASVHHPVGGQLIGGSVYKAEPGTSSGRITRTTPTRSE